MDGHTLSYEINKTLSRDNPVNEITTSISIADSYGSKNMVISALHDLYASLHLMKHNSKDVSKKELTKALEHLKSIEKIVEEIE